MDFSVLEPAAGGLSVVSLFLQAHIVVKLVMVGLLFASIWSWGIIIEKSILLRRVKKYADRFEDLFWSGESLEALYAKLRTTKHQSTATVFVAAMNEWNRTARKSDPKAFRSIQLRVEKVMDVQIAKEMDRIERRMMFLATVGSTAPFIGLFGTVWGIMTSFQAIGVSKNSSLAVVAPGIAEALFATALGLLAAIPAVIFYNRLSHETGRYGQRLESFADEFAAIISRQVDVRSSG